MNLSLITFALFAYNQEDFILEAVESALAQDYDSLEIILSDDCSTDNTYKIIKEICGKYKGHHKIVLNKNEKNLGLAEHINTIIELSTGNIIVFAAGDDISMVNKTRLLVTPMLSNQNIIGVHSAVDEINKNGIFLKKREVYWKKLDDLNYIVENGASVASQAHAFRKEVFEKFGPLNKDVTNEGKVLAFREAALGKIISLEESTIKYRSDVGVSSPTLGDVNKITIIDPIKYCLWYLSAVIQISNDYKKLDCPPEKLSGIIKKNIKYYKLLHEIIVKPWSFQSLLKINSVETSLRIKLVIAFLKRNSPYLLRKAYVKLQ